MNVLPARSLLERRRSYDLPIDTARCLGSGWQGAVYPLQNTDLLVKLYKDPGSKGHTVALVRHLNASGLVAAKASLCGLPLDAFETATGTLGVLMRRAPGVSMGKERYAPLRSIALVGRLDMALSLAQGVAALHAHGIVLADLAEANLLYDWHNRRIFIIDIDGGGVMHGARHRLRPLVRGHDQGSLLPLEVRRGALPSLHSDAWSLAVLLHRHLSHPADADPFFFGRDHRVLEQDGPWPPRLNGQPPELRDLLDHHRLSLSLMGPRLTRAFKQTFGQAGRRHPAQRVPALRWGQALDKVRHWVCVCSACGCEFVAEMMHACPVCGTPAPHATMIAHGSVRPLWQQAQVLTLAHLGVDASRRHALRCVRQQGTFLLEIRSGALTVRSGLRSRDFSAGEQCQLKPGTYRCRYRAETGREVSFRLKIPQGRWPGSAAYGQGPSPATTNGRPRR